MNNLLDWTVKDLEKWINKIEKRAKEFGLDFFEQIFEICAHKDMIGYMAYIGMPSSYPHWSFGKTFEITETFYRYGVRGLPYEMVINSNPCLAYLMRDNALPMQLLTMAHVYAHNDFFKNNKHFGHTHPDLLLERVKTRADRIRSYIEDPSIGPEKVENLLDIARALAMQRSRHFGIKKHLKKQKQFPEADILLFIRDNNPLLEDWEKDILTIIDEEARYFIPQLETKIMNEGWAVYWHYEILKSLDLPEAVYLGFVNIHNKFVSRPKKSVPFINPYHIGFKTWQNIKKRWSEERMFLSRDVDRDTSFLRQYLTENLMRDLDIFQHDRVGNKRKVTRVADEKNWQEVRETLIKNVGINTIPVIKIIDVDYKGQRGLLIRHEHDGRDLFQEYTINTVKYFQKAWKGVVFLETIENNERVLYRCAKNKIKRMG